MSTCYRFLINILLSLVCIVTLHAQQGKTKAGTTKSASVPISAAAVPKNDDKTLGDYVPCLMDKKTLYAMRGRPDGDQPITPNTSISLETAQLIANQSSKNATDRAFQTQYIKNAMLNIDKLMANGTLTYESLANSLKAAAASAADQTTTTLTLDEEKKSIGKQKEAIEASVTQAAAPPPDSEYQRPKNVSCAMSVYSWNVARMIFGRTIANNYLTVQVTVRNLDADHEFLLHDAELAVDATSGQLERFQSSSEKQAVRGVTVYGQSFDRRALWGHGVEGLGFILGAVIGVIDVGNLTSASGAYAAGFEPAFNKLFPDLSTNNLNNLNDLGFSAAAASRIVVPKGGSVPFTIFVPVKPLEQACWLQPGYNPRTDVYPRSACDSLNNIAPYFHFHGIWPTKAPENHEKKYRDWTPDEVAALQKHAFAVVAGMHIQGVDSQGAAARSLTCTTGAATPRVADLKGLPLSCVITGAALSTLKTLHLTPVDGSDRSKTIDLPLVGNGDSTTASFTLSPDQLTSLTASTFSLDGIDGNGKSIALKLSFNIIPLPTLDSLSPTTLKTADLNSTGATLNLNGANLSQVAQLKLALDGSPDTTLAVKIVFSANNTIVAKLQKMSPTTGVYQLFFVLDPASQVVMDTKKTLTIN